jgi:hypothetical protein
MKFTINNETNEKIILGKFGLEDLQSKSQLNTLKEQGVLNERFFQDLEKLQRIEQLVGTEGINVTLANQLNGLIPGFLNENHPLSGFTSTPSPIEKKYSLEAIERFTKNLFTSNTINNYSYWDFGLEDNKVIISIDEHDKELHEHMGTLDKVFEDFHTGHRELLVELENSQQVGLEAADGVLEKIMEFFAKHMYIVIVAIFVFIGALVGWIVEKLLNQGVSDINNVVKGLSEYKSGQELMDEIVSASQKQDAAFKAKSQEGFAEMDKLFKGKLSEVEKEKKTKEDKDTVDGEFKETPKDSIHTKAAEVAKVAEEVGKLLNSQAAYYLLTGKNDYTIVNVIGAIESIWQTLDTVLHDTEKVAEELLNTLKNASDKNTFSVGQGENVCFILNKSTYKTLKLYAFPYGLIDFVNLLNKHGNKLKYIPNEKYVVNGGILFNNHALECLSYGKNRKGYPGDLYSGNDTNKEKIPDFTKNLLKLNEDLKNEQSNLKGVVSKASTIKTQLVTLTKNLSNKIEEIGKCEKPTVITKQICYPSNVKGKEIGKDRDHEEVVSTNQAYYAAYGPEGYFHNVLFSLGFFGGALKDVSKVLLISNKIENNGKQLAHAINSILTDIELETQDSFKF